MGRWKHVKFITRDIWKSDGSRQISNWWPGGPPFSHSITVVYIHRSMANLISSIALNVIENECINSLTSITINQLRLMTIDITAHNADGMVHFWLGKTTESLLDFQPWMIWYLLGTVHGQIIKEKNYYFHLFICHGAANNSSSRPNCKFPIGRPL
jgi:hypothetical protein